MRILTNILLFVFIYTSMLTAQLITKNERIRIGAGISKLASDQFDSMIDEIENETAKVGPGVEVADFSDNLMAFFEYESIFAEQFSYLIYIQYTGNEVTGETTEIAEQIDQGLRFNYNIYNAGLTFTYAIPIFKISTSQTSIIIGAGIDVSYIETESFYYYDQRPAFVQTIEVKRNGGIFGGRFIVGWDIPYVESLAIQLRAGYDLRPEKALPGTTEEFIREAVEKERELMDPEVFASYDTYNFSQIWVAISFAYLF